MKINRFRESFIFNRFSVVPLLYHIQPILSSTFFLAVALAIHFFRYRRSLSLSAVRCDSFFVVRCSCLRVSVVMYNAFVGLRFAVAVHRSSAIDCLNYIIQQTFCQALFSSCRFCVLLNIVYVVVKVHTVKRLFSVWLFAVRNVFRFLTVPGLYHTILFLSSYFFTFLNDIFISI